MYPKTPRKTQRNVYSGTRRRPVSQPVLEEDDIDWQPAERYWQPTFDWDDYETERMPPSNMVQMPRSRHVPYPVRRQTNPMPRNRSYRMNPTPYMPRNQRYLRKFDDIWNWRRTRICAQSTPIAFNRWGRTSIKQNKRNFKRICNIEIMKQYIFTMHLCKNLIKFIKLYEWRGKIFWHFGILCINRQWGSRAIHTDLYLTCGPWNWTNRLDDSLQFFIPFNGNKLSYLCDSLCKLRSKSIYSSKISSLFLSMNRIFPNKNHD